MSCYTHTKDGRAHVGLQGHSWNRAVIPESTGSCRRSAWSTFPPLCSDQSSAGAVRKTVYRRRPGLLPLFHSRLKTFLFCKSFPPQPSLSSKPTPRIPRTFTDISELIRCLHFLVFFFFSLHFSVVGSVR